MFGYLHMATPQGEAYTVAIHSHFGVPSIGLQPRQIEHDEVLLKEMVLRSRLEYFAAECCADDKPINLNNMARSFALLLTCDTSNPVVLLSDLLREVRHRADIGSVLAIRFLHKYDAACRLHPIGAEAIETIVHGLIVGHPRFPRSDFIRQFLGNHKIGCAL
jgi:hypothetical protein